jgi:hypothetical protein
MGCQELILGAMIGWCIGEILVLLWLWIPDYLKSRKWRKEQKKEALYWASPEGQQEKKELFELEMKTSFLLRSMCGSSGD